MIVEIANASQIRKVYQGFFDDLNIYMMMQAYRKLQYGGKFKHRIGMQVV